METRTNFFPIVKEHQMLTLQKSKEKVDWDDLSTHKHLTCVNHPSVRMTTKNPWVRGIFMLQGVDGKAYSEGCKCPFEDVRYVIGGGEA